MTSQATFDYKINGKEIVGVRPYLPSRDRVGNEKEYLQSKLILLVQSEDSVEVWEVISEIAAQKLLQALLDAGQIITAWSIAELLSAFRPIGDSVQKAAEKGFSS